MERALRSWSPPRPNVPDLELKYRFIKEGKPSSPFADKDFQKGWSKVGGTIRELKATSWNPQSTHMHPEDGRIVS